MYIAIRTDDGRNIGKISFYCNTLQVSRQAFYDYLGRKGKPWQIICELNYAAKH